MCIALVLILNSFYKFYDTLLEYCEHVTAALLIVIVVCAIMVPTFLIVSEHEKTSGLHLQWVYIIVMVGTVILGVFLLIGFLKVWRRCAKTREPLTATGGVAGMKHQFRNRSSWKQKLKSSDSWENNNLMDDAPAYPAEVQTLIDQAHQLEAKKSIGMLAEASRLIISQAAGQTAAEIAAAKQKYKDEMVQRARERRRSSHHRKQSVIKLPRSSSQATTISSSQQDKTSLKSTVSDDRVSKAGRKETPPPSGPVKPKISTGSDKGSILKPQSLRSTITVIGGNLRSPPPKSDRQVTIRTPTSAAKLSAQATSGARDVSENFKEIGVDSKPRASMENRGTSVDIDLSFSTADEMSVPDRAPSMTILQSPRSPQQPEGKQDQRVPPPGEKDQRLPSATLMDRDDSPIPPELMLLTRDDDALERQRMLTDTGALYDEGMGLQPLVHEHSRTRSWRQFARQHPQPSGPKRRTLPEIESVELASPEDEHAALHRFFTRFQTLFRRSGGDAATAAVKHAKLLQHQQASTTTGMSSPDSYSYTQSTSTDKSIQGKGIRVRQDSAGYAIPSQLTSGQRGRCYPPAYAAAHWRNEQSAPSTHTGGSYIRSVLESTSVDVEDILDHPRMSAQDGLSPHGGYHGPQSRSTSDHSMYTNDDIWTARYTFANMAATPSEENHHSPQPQPQQHDMMPQQHVVMPQHRHIMPEQHVVKHAVLPQQHVVQHPHHAFLQHDVLHPQPQPQPHNFLAVQHTQPIPFSQHIIIPQEHYSSMTSPCGGALDPASETRLDPASGGYQKHTSAAPTIPPRRKQGQVGAVRLETAASPTYSDPTSIPAPERATQDAPDNSPGQHPHHLHQHHPPQMSPAEIRRRAYRHRATILAQHLSSRSRYESPYLQSTEESMQAALQQVPNSSSLSYSTDSTTNNPGGGALQQQDRGGGQSSQDSDHRQRMQGQALTQRQESESSQIQELYGRGQKLKSHGSTSKDSASQQDQTSKFQIQDQQSSTQSQKSSASERGKTQRERSITEAKPRTKAQQKTKETKQQASPSQKMPSSSVKLIEGETLQKDKPNDRHQKRSSLSSVKLIEGRGGIDGLNHGSITRASDKAETAVLTKAIVHR